jgi:hypothetical protein
MPAPDDLLSETNACDVLTRLFRARGYKIARNIPFREHGVSFHIDGWDAKARVGFEFLTSEDEDHDDLTLDEYKALMDAQQRGELALFIIDEVEPLSAADLTYTVTEFLDEVAEAAKAQRGRRRGKPAVKKAATNATQRTAKKPTAKKSKKKAAGQAANGKATAKPVKQKSKAKPAGGKKPAAQQKAVKRGAKKSAENSAKKAGKKSAKKSAKKAGKKRTR